MKKKFSSFEDARKFAKTLSLRSGSEWKKLAKHGQLPDGIPHDPAKSYKKEWVGWKDWLGYEKRYQKTANYRNFHEAREFIHSLKIKNQKEWRRYIKSGKKPQDIPFAPDHVYDQWISWGDWLGTGKIHPKYLEFLPFEKAREFARTLKLESVKEWFAYCDSSKKPKNIPRDVSSYYKQNWVSWGDWLSTNSIPPRGKRMLSFEEARKFARTLNLKGKDDWTKFVKTDNRPYYIPVDPRSIYRNKGWISWNDWVGTKIDPRNMNFKSYEDAKKIIVSFEVKNQNEWTKFVKTDKKPIDIPANPRQYYKKEWKGWGDFLSTGNISNIIKSQNYLSFNEAKKFVHSLGLKNTQEWRDYCKSGKKPDDIPAIAEIYYKNKGWKGMGDWLGTGHLSTIDISKNYLSFEDARNEARRLAQELGIKTRQQWVDAKKQGKIPNNIPSQPWEIYSKGKKKK